MPTTITVDPKVRDRLKKFGNSGMTYNDILTRLMDRFEEEEFTAEIEEGKTVYAEIPGFSGVWASGSTREETAAELRQVLQGWIDLQLERNQALPEIHGIRPPQVSFAWRACNQSFLEIPA